MENRNLGKELISVLCPTRGRPNNTTRLLSSIEDTVTNLDKIEVIFFLDNDDVIGQDGIRIDINRFPKLAIKGLVGPRITLSKMWNICSANCSGSIQMHCGDDIVFKTHNWDEIVRQKFAEYPDRIVFVHGTDGHNTDNFGTHGFLHIEWINTIGYFVPPHFSSDFNDTWLNDVAARLERRAYIPILTEHMHPLFGKAELDQTHQERLVRHKKDKVEELYASKLLEREIDVLKLRFKILEHSVTTLKRS